MGKAQEFEWAEAQKIAISQDLVAAAKQQLEFLASVDRNRGLYDGPVLDKAIYRYKYFWLPLLAKHVESKVSEGPFVVPLDCEWVWHCHRLNPIRYKVDCFKLYGRILGCENVVSSVAGASRKQSEAIWNKMYPNEPYEFNMTDSLVVQNLVLDSPSTDYDLVSAVQRQSTFFYQVSRPYMKDEAYLEGAVARYKGFLYLIKRNKESNIKRFCVPLYDIDLIWHSHQLNPRSYCKDLVGTIGEVLEHDDTDSDRSKGNKLDVGFSGTIKQWEETFGQRYRRAGAMYRGNAPSPLDISLTQLNKTSKVNIAPSYKDQDIVKLQKKMFVEVMLEIVEVRNLPEHMGSFYMYFSKKQPDIHFNSRKRLNINPSSEEKQLAVFQCEPTGELAFQLMSDLGTEKSPKLLGTTSINLRDLLNPAYKLSLEKWFDLAPISGFVAGSKPISLHIAFSHTNPVPAPHVLLLVPTNPFSRKLQNDKSWTSVVDETGKEVLRIQMRKNSLASKEVIGMTLATETRVLAEFLETGWSLLMNSRLHLQKKSSDVNEHAFELRGSSKKMMILPGRKLDYANKCCEKKETKLNFMTVVEFSEEHPYGKAVALLNLNSGCIEIKEDWLVMPVILCGFILAKEIPKEMDNDAKENQSIVNKEINKITTLKKLLSSSNGFSQTDFFECAMGTQYLSCDKCGCNCNGGSSGFATCVDGFSGASNCNGGSSGFATCVDGFSGASNCNGGSSGFATCVDGFSGASNCNGGSSGFATCVDGFSGASNCNRGSLGFAHCGGGGCGGGCSGVCGGRCGGAGGRCGGSHCGW